MYPHKSIVPNLWEYSSYILHFTIYPEGKRMITFKPLWITLKKKNISTYDLIHHYGMSRGMLDNLKHDRSITLHTLNDLCNTFECDISDIIEYSKDEKEL